MKIIFLTVGKTDEAHIKKGIDIYQQRLKHYVNFEIQELPALKNTKSLTTDQQKQEEGETILKKVAPQDHLVLLDEKGKSFTSRNFSGFIEGLMVKGLKNIYFVVGGPYGFSDKVYQRANFQISLSKMTFPHQLVRLMFVEQLYRAMSILKNEPYHHD